MRFPRRRKIPTRRRLVFNCGAAAVVMTAGLAILRPSFLVRLDDTAYDVVMRSARLQPIGSKVVIVDVDERSLSTVGQWPWRRDVMAKLVSRLRTAGASTIALDVIFAEADRDERVAGVHFQTS